MDKEYEVVTHTKMKHITAFLVRLEQRVTHIHRELELGYVMEGSLSLRTKDRTVSIRKGDIYLVNRMEPHEFASEGEGALLIAIQISPGLTDGLHTPNVHYHYEGCSNVRIDLEDKPGLYREICGFCIELAYSFLRMEENDAFRCLTLCAALVHLLHKGLTWQQMDTENYAALKLRANRMMQITNYIDRNFQRKLLLSEIAERENLSMVYLSHFFKDTMGMSFQEYLSQKRLEYACELLFTTNRNILDISISSGFSDVRYFNRAFISAYGYSPREFRKGSGRTAGRDQAFRQNTQSFLSEGDALRLLLPLRLQARQKLEAYSLTELI